MMIFKNYTVLETPGFMKTLNVFAIILPVLFFSSCKKEFNAGLNSPFTNYSDGVQNIPVLLQPATNAFLVLGNVSDKDNTVFLSNQSATFKLFDTDLKPLVTRHYFGTNANFISSVIQHNSGGYLLAGGTAHMGNATVAGNPVLLDPFLLKTDALGNQEWIKVHEKTGNLEGIDQDYITNILQDNVNNIFVSGNTLSQKASPGIARSSFVFIQKNNPQGNQQNINYLIDSVPAGPGSNLINFSSLPNGLQQTKNGNLLLVCSRIHTDQNPGRVSIYTLDKGNLAVLSRKTVDSNIIRNGTLNMIRLKDKNFVILQLDPGKKLIWLIKFNPEAQIIFKKIVVLPNPDSYTRLFEDPNGDILLYGAKNAGLVKLDQEGQYKSEIDMSGFGNEFTVLSVCDDPMGGYVLGCNYRVSKTGNINGVVLKLEQNLTIKKTE